MTEEKEKRRKQPDVEEITEILNVVSKEVPSLIKALIESVFSEQAGRDMGKAAAAFYKELKDAGMPEETAVKMTENYVAVFTSLGDIMKGMGRERGAKGQDIGEEISRRVKERVAERTGEKEEE
jgi:hypothetical protein